MIPPTPDTPTGKSGEAQRNLRALLGQYASNGFPPTHEMSRLADKIWENREAFCAVLAAEQRGTEGSLNAERLAQMFLEAYEAIAPQFGYKTREDSAKPWKEVPEQNRKVMVATAAYVLREVQRLSAAPSPAGDEASLREALKPLARIADAYNRVGKMSALPDDFQVLHMTDHVTNEPLDITLGDCRRAAAALAASPAARQCEVCAKLPKTRDGVSIVPGMTVWVPQYATPGHFEDAECLVTGVTNFNAAGAGGDGEESFHTAQDDCHPDCDRSTPASWAYSTREAALAASPAPESAAPSTEAKP